jgi:hypothetical protein
VNGNICRRYGFDRHQGEPQATATKIILVCSAVTHLREFTGFEVRYRKAKKYDCSLTSQPFTHRLGLKRLQRIFEGGAGRFEGTVRPLENDNRQEEDETCIRGN